MNYYPLDKIDQHHDQPCFCDACGEIQRAFDATDLEAGVRLVCNNTKRMQEYWASKEPN